MSVKGPGPNFDLQRQSSALDQACRPIDERPVPLNPIHDSLDLHPVPSLRVDESVATPSSQSLERGALSTIHHASTRAFYPRIPLKNRKVKGGETQDYELYIDAVDDVEVDISDTATTWNTVVD